MTVSTLRPTSTTSNTGAVTGASAHAALSDDSDASYVDYDTLELSRLGFGDLTLPAGAVIKSVAARFRTAQTSGSGAVFGVQDTEIPGAPEPFGSVNVTWAVATTTTIGTYAAVGITDSAVDSALLFFGNVGSGTVRAYEAFFDVTYVTQPTLTVAAPADPVTDTNLPTFTITPTLDSDGGAQTLSQYRVFTDAQYGAGGFDPSTSTATAESGQLAGAGTTWQSTNVLADDTYRVYARVAQTVNGATHWSDWAFDQFDLAVVLPGTPTLDATADNSNARIALAITDNPGSASTDQFEIQRSLDGGTTWESIRTIDGDGQLEIPYVAATGVFSDGSDGTSHALVLPAPTGGILANDLLIAVVGMDGNPTFTWPAGWTEIKDEAGNGSAVRAGVAWYRAVGGESGTVTLTTSASEGGGAQILCIRNASTTTAPEVSTGVSGSGANADPDSLNPSGWGTEPSLWIAAMVNDGNVAVTAGPSGYYDFLNTRWANASGAGVATASLMSNAASANPGAFTQTAEDTRAFTIGVRPRNATLTVYDYEAPNGVATQYRARALHDYSGVFAASAWASDTETWSSTSWWLKHPQRPDLNMAVRIRSFASTQRAGRTGVFQPLGSTSALVVSDTRGPTTGTVVFRLDSLSEQDDLDALLDEVATLMLQSPAGQGGPDYVRFGDQDRQRTVDWASAAQVFDANTFTKVAAPSGDVVAWP